MRLQVLIATMHQSDYSLLEKMNIQSDAIVINQSDNNSKDDIALNRFNIKWINSNEIGLSKSRNMAIGNSNSEICLVADDDLIYIDNYESKVKEQFAMYPNADIITFQVEGIENNFKNYYSKPRKLNFLTTMKVSSVEMAFKRKSIVENNIRFNEMFGSGAQYYAGEENIFLYDCLKKGLIVQYVPIKIANLHLGNSSWFKGYTEDYLLSRGAIFTAMSKTFAIPLILQFIIRKYSKYNSQCGFIRALRNSLKGRKEYLLKNNSASRME